MRRYLAWGVVVLGMAAWVPVVHHALAHWGHTHHHRMPLGEELAYWLAMVLAMMWPLLALQSHAIASRSFTERRTRAVVLFLAGYLVPWLAFGAVVAVVHDTLPVLRSPSSISVAFAAAAVWTLVPLRARAMTASHGYAPVLAPEGLAADRDCVRAGVAVGATCLLSCWVFMAACAFSGHHLAPMAVGGVVAIVEAWSFEPPQRVALIAAAAMAIMFLIR